MEHKVVLSFAGRNEEILFQEGKEKKKARVRLMKVVHAASRRTEGFNVFSYERLCQHKRKQILRIKLRQQVMKRHEMLNGV